MQLLLTASPGECRRIERGLELVGKSLHGEQDALSHNALHQAETEFDHIPSVYCLLWLDPAGLIIPECIEARRNNPNWYDPLRPDKKSVWPAAALEAALAAHNMGNTLMDIPVVACHCRER